MSKEKAAKTGKDNTLRGIASVPSGSQGVLELIRASSLEPVNPPKTTGDSASEVAKVYKESLTKGEPVLVKDTATKIKDIMFNEE